MAFKDVMKKTKGTSLVPVRVDELFLQTYERLSESIDITIGNTIETLEKKMAEIKAFNLQNSGGVPLI